MLTMVPLIAAAGLVICMLLGLEAGRWIGLRVKTAERGGYVYVTRGLLTLVSSEDELAGVVGHEIGPVAAHHTVLKISRQGPFALLTNLVAWMRADGTGRTCRA